VGGHGGGNGTGDGECFHCVGHFVFLLMVWLVFCIRILVKPMLM
jgi:hypothetical protein